MNARSSSAISSCWAKWRPYVFASPEEAPLVRAVVEHGERLLAGDRRPNCRWRSARRTAIVATFVAEIEPPLTLTNWIRVPNTAK